MQSLEPRLLLSGAVATISTPTFMPGASNFAVTVEFADASPIDTSTIGVKNLAVSGATVGALTVTGDAIDASNPDDVFATYYVNAPNLIWDQRANDTYTIALQPDQVLDSQGAAAAATSTTMTVNLQPITAPLAAASAPSLATITTPGTTSGPLLEVTYSDPAGVNISTINSDNLVSFTTSLNVHLVSVASQDSGQVVHATYLLTAPHGAFFPSDNTGYHIVLASGGDGAVFDTAGTMFSSGILAQDVVSIDPTDPASPFADSTSSQFVPEASATQSNGKLIVAGHIGNTTTGQSQIEIECFNADGSLDPNFGNDGLVLGPTGSNEAAFAMTVLPNDQILMAGTSAKQFMLERFNADGTPDTSFGRNGTGEVTTAISSVSSSEIADTLAIAPDGTIVTAGYADGAWAFARYTADGSPINSFVLDLPDGNDGTVGGLAITSGGQIVAAGADGTGVDVAVLDSNGNLDPSFNGGAVLPLPALAVRDDLGYIDHNVGLAIAGSNFIVAATTPTSPGEFAVERISDSGVPDTSFGPSQTGVVTTAFSGDADARNVAPQSNGAIVVSGINVDSAGTHAVSVTYNNDGSIYASTPPPPTAASIFGTAFNGQTGLPLPDVTIELNAGQATTTTDANGQYDFPNLPAGTYDVTELPPAGLAPQVATASVTAAAAPVAGPDFENLPAVSTASAAPDLIAAFASSPPNAVIGGAKGQLTLRIRNIGNAKAMGNINIALFADSSNTLTPGTSPFATVPAHLNLKAGGSTTVHLKFTYPSDLSAAGYYILASVDSTNVIPESNESNNLAASSAVTISPPAATLGGSIAAPEVIIAKKTAAVSLFLTNNGNILASGTIGVSFFASDDQTLDPSDAPLTSVSVHIHLEPAAHGRYQLHFKLPAGLVAGGKFLIAKINAATIADISDAVVTLPAGSQSQFS